jgi:hypothetical protein
MLQTRYYSYGTFWRLPPTSHPGNATFVAGLSGFRAFHFRFKLARLVRRLNLRDARARKLKSSEEEFTMRNKLGGFCLLTALVITSLAAPLYASNKPFKRTVIAPRYQASKEVTMEGTIQSVVKKPTPGSMLGTHLMVSTSKGTIDAHIGTFVTRGSHGYSPAVGQSVKIVGVMTTVNHKEVFLTRSIESGNRTVQVRTAHGFLIVPGVKGRMVKTSTTGGAR